MLAYTGDTATFCFGKALYAHFRFFNLNSGREQSQSLGVSTSCIRSWLRDSTLPKIDEFLNVLYRFNVKPIEFLTQRHLEIGSSGQTTLPFEVANQPAKRRSKTELNHERTEELLTKALSSRVYSRMSFRSFCKNDLKQSHGAVRNRFPEIAKEFSSKHLHYRDARCRVSKAGIEAEIREAAKWCREQGMPTNKRNMIHFLKKPGIFRGEWTNELVSTLQNST
ncbi:hypothetical protein [Pelagicoccus mobilis]|uniref:Uncharacterized protein n=1 Tax=Pelagicoccus mobilis TaxID=415221 RepID=A0A934VMW3_9BACT|nr:hypothetical protein [Pelagicoccus mobilis]MBK1875602.1 hypothetical protein [Pelagicoccus mobilis]